MKGQGAERRVVIPVIGPSKAGKTQATQALLASGVLPSLERMDLDEELGPAHRSDGVRAASLVQDLEAGRVPRAHVLVDVGAGQFFSEAFRTFLNYFPGYPESVVVIWCDEATFRRRHGANAPNEVEKYYGASSPLHRFREAAPASGRLVDTSGAHAPALWAENLERIVRAIIV